MSPLSRLHFHLNRLRHTLLCRLWSLIDFTLGASQEVATPLDRLLLRLSRWACPHSATTFVWQERTVEGRSWPYLKKVCAWCGEVRA